MLSRPGSLPSLRSEMASPRSWMVKGVKMVSRLSVFSTVFLLRILPFWSGFPLSLTWLWNIFLDCFKLAGKSIFSAHRHARDIALKWFNRLQLARSWLSSLQSAFYVRRLRRNVGDRKTERVEDFASCKNKENACQQIAPRATAWENGKERTRFSCLRESVCFVLEHVTTHVVNEKNLNGMHIWQVELSVRYWSSSLRSLVKLMPYHSRVHLEYHSRKWRSISRRCAPSLQHDYAGF